MNEGESIRLKQFRQLKKELRGSKDHLIVGIEVAKGTHKPFLGTATGKTLLKRLVFEALRGSSSGQMHSRCYTILKRQFLALSPPPTTINH